MTAPAIPAIETAYRGCRFRSRLEARWAVFFDALGIVWEYEAQGFVVPMPDGSSRPYLPDFWLPGLEVHAEVKGSDPARDYLAMLANAIEYQATPIATGLVLLGPIPDPAGARMIFHDQLKWDKGVVLLRVAFTGEWPPLVDWPWGGVAAPASECPEGTTWHPVHVGFARPSAGLAYTMDRTSVARAYRAARSARFEHGETPAAPPPSIASDPVVAVAEAIALHVWGRSGGRADCQGREPHTRTCVWQGVSAAERQIVSLDSALRCGLDRGWIRPGGDYEAVVTGDVDPTAGRS